MLIVSWNVAGWRTTLDKIKQRHKSLQNWLEKMNIDILCIQEVKINSLEIEAKAIELGAKIENYDTFWSFPHQISKHRANSQGKGLNGVATFVRKGWTCSSSAVGLTEKMNEEGRCLITDHGSFVIFNVYVPFNGMNYARLPFKLQFLNELKKSMRYQKMTGKRVILCGDLNLSGRGLDAARSFRKIDVTNILDNIYTDSAIQYLSAASRASLNAAFNYIRYVWPGVRDSLKNSRTIENDDFNGNKRYKVCCTRPDGKKIKLGKSTTWQPEFEYVVERVSMTTSMTRDNEPEHALIIGEHVSLEPENSIVIKSANTLTLEELRECLRQLTDRTTQSNSSLTLLSDSTESATGCSGDDYLSISENTWNLIADLFGGPAHHPLTVDWFRSLLRHDVNNDNISNVSPTDELQSQSPGLHMVDSFATMYPTVDGRYTCWDQSSNKRYVNEGARIDYILVDEDLWRETGAAAGCEGAVLAGVHEMIEARGVEAGKTQCSESSSELASVQPQPQPQSQDDQMSDKLRQQRQTNDYMSALYACTAGGMFKMAGYDGTGIPDAPAEAFDCQFPKCPHTGMIYTPPEYSDHIAVSLYLPVCDSITTPSVLARDAATKATQPHMQQTDISSFFGAAAAVSGKKRAAMRVSASGAVKAPAAVDTMCDLSTSDSTTQYKTVIDEVKEATHGSHTELSSSPLPADWTSALFKPSAAQLRVGLSRSHTSTSNTSTRHAKNKKSPTLDNGNSSIFSKFNFSK